MKPNEPEHQKQKITCPGTLGKPIQATKDKKCIGLQEPEKG